MRGARPTRLAVCVLVVAAFASASVPVVVRVIPPPLVPSPATVAPGDDDPARYVVSKPTPGSFPLFADERAAPIVVSRRDHHGVARVAGDLSADIGRVTGTRPDVDLDRVPRSEDIVLVGTLGRSPLIDRLVRAGKLDVRGVAGKWETSLEQVVVDPMPGVRRAFVIAGSDQRGTIYGAYDVSKQIGVSPWYWWDDVPVPRLPALHVLPGPHTQGTPAVKYRGIFINDENPALGTWAPAHFGPGLAPGHPDGFNHEFYARVYETMLRLKANVLWPAVWNRAFAEDDPANHRTASEYGVIIGTSHEGPMMRGIEEWNRQAVPPVYDRDGHVVRAGHDSYGGNGEWSFRTNRAAVERYWADGIRRMVDQKFDGMVTLGMRGTGDAKLADGGGVGMMREIVASQRRIIAEVTGKDPSTVPQVQTLYREVQRYWDDGMRPPDDVTVVFSDDDWGNIRRLPDPGVPPRAGGYGLYYHLDYVGGPRNYKWVDTNLVPNIWDQLNQAYSYGVDRLWVANVGDLKNEELPLQVFLDYAWNPDRWPLERIDEWERLYAAQNFDDRYASAIAGILRTYAHLQARRKPELLNRRITADDANPPHVTVDDRASPFSLTDYQELDRATAEWQRLAARAEHVRARLPAGDQDAYYQLVYYQVKATANLYALRRAEFTNLLYAAQGRAATNRLSDVADARLADDRAMSDYYNDTLAGGKWWGFQTQPKIGYGDVARYGPHAGWQQPQQNEVPLPDEIYPPPRRIGLPAQAELGVAIDGSDQWWPASSAPAMLPALSPYQSQPEQYIDVFNRGSTPFDYTVRSAEPWVTVTPGSGRVGEQVRVTVQVDWTRAPVGRHEVPVTVSGAGRSVIVLVPVDKPALSPGAGFVEAGGYVSMEAEHFSRAFATPAAAWRRIPDIGRTASGMTPLPVTAPSPAAGAGPRLEYDMTLFTAGEVRVWAYVSPRNAVLAGYGPRYAVSLDGEPPQVVNITTDSGSDDAGTDPAWGRNVSDNVNRTVTTHVVAAPGRHVLRIWMIDPTVVVQKLVVDTGGLRPSYLGPPESRRV
jgi:hypothetical protein